MNDNTKTPLVSSEISGIWNSLMGESLFSSIIKTFGNKTEDNEVNVIIQNNINLSIKRIEMLTNMLEQKGLPVPESFGDKEINLNAPQLYTDYFYLQYLIYASKVAMQNYTVLLSEVSCTEIRDYFSKCVNDSIALYNDVTNLCLARGIFVKMPFIEVSPHIEYEKNENTILTWFGKKRPLFASEITDIVYNVYGSEQRKMMLCGFKQVCTNKPLCEIIQNGIDFATAHNKEFTSILTDEDIQMPTYSSAYLTNSTESPFSDKLMINKILLMCSVKITNLGVGLANTRRSDLQKLYVKYLDDIMKYAQDTMSVMIDNKWLEEPPQAIKHEDLINK